MSFAEDVILTILSFCVRLVQFDVLCIFIATPNRKSKYLITSEPIAND